MAAPKKETTKKPNKKLIITCVIIGILLLLVGSVVAFHEQFFDYMTSADISYVKNPVKQIGEKVYVANEGKGIDAAYREEAIAFLEKLEKSLPAEEELLYVHTVKKQDGGFVADGNLYRDEIISYDATFTVTDESGSPILTWNEDPKKAEYKANMDRLLPEKEWKEIASILINKNLADMGLGLEMRADVEAVWMLTCEKGIPYYLCLINDFNYVQLNAVNGHVADAYFYTK